MSQLRETPATYKPVPGVQLALVYQPLIDGYDRVLPARSSAALAVQWHRVGRRQDGVTPLPLLQASSLSPG
jgi:hypothetical protein